MKLPVINKKEVFKGIWEMSFGLKDKNFSFKAGQYIRVVLPSLEKEDTKGPARTFSVASSPNDKEKIDIVFRLTDSGFKQTLINLPLGQEVEVEGPWGNLVLPEDQKEPLIFIAGGTGISPFLSILRFVTEEKLPHKITLLYTLRDSQDAAYIKELEGFKDNSNFNLSVNFGLIDQEFLKSNIPSASNSPIYISGPPPMIDAAIKMLGKMGVLSEQIHFEDWSEFSFQQILGSFFTYHPDGILVADLNGFIRYVDPAWEVLTGWRGEEVIEKFTPRILKSGDKDQEFYANLWNRSLAGNTVREEFTNKRKDKTLYSTDEVFIPLKNQAGGIFGHVAFQRDITQRKKIEAELALYTKKLELAVAERTKEIQEDRAKDEAILLSIGDGLVVTDGVGKIILVNRVFEESLGWKKEEVLGRNLIDVVPNEDEGGGIILPERRPSQIALSSGRRFATDTLTAVYFVKKDKSRFPVAITVAPIIFGGGAIGVVEIFRDVTKEKEIDRAKTEFISLASHQLRTPLSTIKWVLEVMMEETDNLNDKQKDRLKDLFVSNERLISLVEDLLSVSRIETGKLMVNLKPSNLKSLIEDSIKLLQPKADEEQKKISLSIEAKLKEIMADQFLFSEAFKNLLDNAISFANKGTTVDIKVNKQDINYVVSVHDFGPPILETEEGKIFTKFYRGPQAQYIKQKGTGLGLFIAKSAIESMGGTIWFDSFQDGVTFYISIPIKNK
ncbi:MAG: PAS domain S-box protein [Candidatus Harrisonbacteria bacterium]|nr:PAS domain S-box protein [Candidatus Harrisonbacteria bacterium]